VSTAVSEHRTSPAAGPEARAVRATFERTQVLETVSIVNNLRNRAAHHEPFVSGLPYTATATATATSSDSPPTTGHNACKRLARLLDRDLTTWMLAQATSHNLWLTGTSDRNLRQVATVCRSPRYMAHFRQIKWPHSDCVDTAPHALDLRR